MALPRRRHVLVGSVALVMTLVLTSVALAWGDLYVDGPVTFYQGHGPEQSGFNSSLNGNVLEFDNIYGGNPTLGSRYVNTSGVGLNSYRWETATFIDWRTVSYGAAQCKSNTANAYWIEVYQCYTSN